MMKTPTDVGGRLYVRYPHLCPLGFLVWGRFIYPVANCYWLWQLSLREGIPSPWFFDSLEVMRGWNPYAVWDYRAADRYFKEND